MIQVFRVIAFFEGVSYILLLFIASPIKYFLENDIYVKLLGMPHGILFLIYIYIAFKIKNHLNWDSKKFLLILLASVIPFGTFYVDYKYFK